MAQLSEQVHIGDSAKATLRTHLEICLYRLAWEHATNARAVCPGDDELDHALRAIILAAACLEAFINLEGMAAYGLNWDDYESGRARPCGRRPSVEDKWLEVTARITGGQTFEKGKQPFQGFHQLVRLRDYVLHYKAPYKAAVPHGLRGSTQYVAEARAKLDAQAAQMVVKSMKGMLVQFHDLTGQTLPKWVT